MTPALLGVLLLAPFLGEAQKPGKSPSPAALRDADNAFHAGYAAVQRNDLKAAEADFAEVVRLTPAVAAGHAAYGSVLLSVGKLNEAIHQLELAHAGDPAESSATLNLARAYGQAGNHARALPLFDHSSADPAALSPDDWYQYAQLLLAADDPEKADEKLLAAVAAYPQNALLEDTLGVVLAKQQDYPAAVERFRRAEALDPTMVEPHKHLGTALLMEKRTADAFAEWKTAASLRPEDPAIHLDLGRALTADHQDEAAIATLQHALQLNGASSRSALTLDIKYALAIALQNAGRNPEALPLFQETAEVRPADSAVLTNLGLTLVELGKAKEAMTYYEKAETLNAGDWILQQDIGVAYLQQSDLDHAIKHFQSGLAIDPKNAQLHYDLGLAYKLKDKLPEAIAAFTKAEEEDASLADAPYTLGVLYMQTGKFAQAQIQLRRATALRPENGDAWSVLGSVDRSLNKMQEAVQDLQTAIQLQPLLPGNHITLAAIYAQEGHHDDAVAERAIAANLSRNAVNKQKSFFALESGRALLKQKQVEEAVKQIELAITADPENSAAHLALADALTTQGKTADAALERQKAAAPDMH